MKKLECDVYDFPEGWEIKVKNGELILERGCLGVLGDASIVAEKNGVVKVVGRKVIVLYDDLSSMKL
jgi:hypothetical protein